MSVRRSRLVMSLLALLTPTQAVMRGFNARERRERITLVLALAAAVCWLADTVWIAPARVRSDAAAARLLTAQADLLRMRADTAGADKKGSAREHLLSTDIAAARASVDAQARALRADEAALVGADQMVDLLEAMLPRNGRVKVLALKSTGVSDLGTPAAAKDGKPPGLYKHGVELKVAGGWSDLLDYLGALEAMPRHVLWGGVAMKVTQYPTVEITLRLYTLSVDRGWLEL